MPRLAAVYNHYAGSGQLVLPRVIWIRRWSAYVAVRLGAACAGFTHAPFAHAVPRVVLLPLQLLLRRLQLLLHVEVGCANNKNRRETEQEFGVGSVS